LHAELLVHTFRVRVSVITEGGDVMFRIKAIAALALAGLGGATMGADVYLASHRPAAHGFELPKYQAPNPAPVAVEASRVQKEARNDVVTIEPVTITSRPRARHRPVVEAASEPQQEFVPCSNWRSLETGPAGRGVRTLCTRSAPAAAE
jgi:hypothetical protein